jgi:hypothetical protein
MEVVVKRGTVYSTMERGATTVALELAFLVMSWL